MTNKFYHGDCKFVMNHDIEPGTVDLIYLDPPFFTGKVQKATIRDNVKWEPGEMEVSYNDSKKFWGDSIRCKEAREQSPIWLQQLATDRPDFASYLWYMIQRLVACKRVLKPTGSIYLHCDWRASHYLKMIMDNIFGYDNFQNDISWHYSWGIHTNKRWNRKHDAILFYTKSHKYTFNANDVRVPYSANSVMSQDPKYNKGFNEAGKLAEDVWDIPTLNAMSSERVGYPTQKPIFLLKRIIQASSNEGDLVLDPFCGCGTCIIAAHDLKRRWIGIDISEFAYKTTTGRETQAPLNLYGQISASQYIPRNLEVVKALSPSDFEAWVNEYYKATKPMPDKGVDGIMQDGTPIQTKTNLVKHPLVAQFSDDLKRHHAVPQPVKKAIMVSQVGFDGSARKRQFEIETTDGIKIEFKTPEEMLVDK